MSQLIHLAVSALAVIITSFLLPGVEVGIISAFITALVLGLLNTFVKPIMILFTLPVNVLTLGLFTFVINAVIILTVSAVVPGFKVKGFWWALLFSLILSIVNHFLERYFKI